MILGIEKISLLVLLMYHQLEPMDLLFCGLNFVNTSFIKKPRFLGFLGDEYL